MAEDEFPFLDFQNPSEELMALLLEFIQREVRPVFAEQVPPTVAELPSIANSMIDQNIAILLHTAARRFENDNGPTSDLKRNRLPPRAGSARSGSRLPLGWRRASRCPR
jgi:hypothetical protein